MIRKTATGNNCRKQPAYQKPRWKKSTKRL